MFHRLKQMKMVYIFLIPRRGFFEKMVLISGGGHVQNVLEKIKIVRSYIRVKIICSFLLCFFGTSLVASPECAIHQEVQRPLSLQEREELTSFFRLLFRNSAIAYTLF